MPQKSEKNKAWAKPFGDFVPCLEPFNRGKRNTPATTVHAVKGETHDVTIFVCPDEGEEGRDPCEVWWSCKEADREERRIAYVAMTRTKGDLIVWMGPESYDHLVANRQAFAESFQHTNVDDVVSALDPNPS